MGITDTLKDTLLKVRTTLPEDLYGTPDQTVQVGATIPNFVLPMASGSDFELDEVLKRGPVILNFIKGTWCPYCQLHLKNLRDWQERIVSQNKQASVTVIIISNEPLPVIRKWLKANPVLCLFASDLQGVVARSFGVNLSPEEFLKPATFLVDSKKTVRMVFAGARKAAPLDAIAIKISETGSESE